MSVALTDFLIAVSDPIELKRYQEAPQELLAEFPLTPGDLQALESANPGWIRFQSILETDRTDLKLEHFDIQNANGFMMNNQASTGTSTQSDHNVSDVDSEFIDEDGNAVTREPED